MSEEKDFSKRFEDEQKGKINRAMSYKPKDPVTVSISIVVGILIVAFMFNFLNREPSTAVTSNAAPTYVNSSSVAVTALEMPATQETAKPEQPAAPKEYKLNEMATVGKFDIIALDDTIETEIKGKYSSEKTENQYVVITLKVTNNDDRARDVGGSMFTLIDSKNRSYQKADVAMTDQNFLMYETINPGLSKTFKIAFETARGLKGFKLKTSSGVLLAGLDSSALIDLGI